MQLLELTDHAADDAKRGAVAVENRVKPLLLLGWVVGVGIPHLPLLMARPGFPTPSPEVAAGEASAPTGIVGHKLEDIFIIGVAPHRGRARTEAHAVAGIAKLLHEIGRAHV